ncbi:hypothetical protein [Escherichia albertii]|nr:hypothetical protein [Escherichia albertii]MCZ8555141.1 hypothetical protein [Escherichia albertii]MCZ8559451.1 hypothetical protein [Escherichia albertii]MCZ8563655.1 hypothetical protein [Escherichia albertii]MCZ8568010.1 hypothetical protein [Escherichia albertii]MCZ8576780.1 hypothetical protein [Escherichia albertii]
MLHNRSRRLDYKIMR